MRRSRPDHRARTGARLAYLFVLSATVLLAAYFAAPACVTVDRARAAGSDAVLLAAGDIASCGTYLDQDEATAKLLDANQGDGATLGGNAYLNGSVANFRDCYGPTWGRHKALTHPSAGNHDYETAGAAGYFGYFGGAAGNPSQGWYSYELGAWHIIVLNSNCAAVGGCSTRSPQETWLRADLATHPSPCTLAYWHQPRFSSRSPRLRPNAAPAARPPAPASSDAISTGSREALPSATYS